ncbi:hypothetical protein MNBD_GAMMA14-275 [hydrothermal vent metagenome]|uniref:Iron-binding zinc finger CDGSH type domain-containing protein n=1 Tax=hydrothermal vent metagenome TaxID=652676 RepID=A0A3B0YU82_9ZZZZ
MSKKDEYKGTEVTIYFDAKKCIHAGVCVLTLPKVFKVNAKGPWIVPDNADAEDVAALAHNCPSGAITYKRHDKNKPELPPVINAIKVLENGPLAFLADIEMDGSESLIRATLCRCGASRNKPFCDGRHAEADFTATGEPGVKTSEPLSQQQNGKLTVGLLEDGPLLCKGDMEICSGTGQRINPTREAALCRCGASKDKPYCDGSHVAIGFTSG